MQSSLISSNFQGTFPIRLFASNIVHIFIHEGGRHFRSIHCVSLLWHDDESARRLWWGTEILPHSSGHRDAFSTWENFGWRHNDAFWSGEEEGEEGSLLYTYKKILIIHKTCITIRVVLGKDNHCLSLWTDPYLIVGLIIWDCLPPFCVRAAYLGSFTSSRSLRGIEICQSS